MYEQTPLNEIAEYIDEENLVKIEQVIKTYPNYLTYNEPHSGNNLLFLALLLKKYNSFKTLLDLGASPNSINIYSHHSILVAACAHFNNIEDNSEKMDLRFVEILLKNGANPNYVAEEHDDRNGRSYFATSPLIEASKFSLELVKLLLRSGADPNIKIGKHKVSSLESAMSGYDKFVITNYLIDSAKVNVHDPLFINGIDTNYIQHYVKTYMNGDEENVEKRLLIEKLEKLGVDFSDQK